jgi:hypothetical protein
LIAINGFSQNLANLLPLHQWPRVACRNAQHARGKRDCSY